jgi:hypothetical protein
VRGVPDWPMDRREFLKALGRLGALGGLTLLGLRSLTGASRRETCLSSGVCSMCAFTAGCGLPQALSYKNRKART